MTITLQPELEAMIREDIARGCYDSAEQFLEEAVRSLHGRQSFMVTNVEELRAAVEEGWLSGERGPLLTAEESRALLESEMALWSDQSGTRV